MKWYAAAAAIFPAVTAAVLLGGAGAGWVDLSRLDLAAFALVFGGTLLANFIKNIFEETAWRGYLTSQLVKLNLHDGKIYLIVGCIWGLWHIPYYLVFLPVADIQAVMPVGRAAYAGIAVVTMLCWTVMFVELYRITGSVWPCVLLHTVEDSLLITLVVSDYLSIVAGREFLVSPISGIVPSILYLLVGLGIRACRKRAGPAAAGRFNAPSPQQA
jgi:hypothetical protein